MGALAALVALGATLMAGLFFVAMGGAITAAALQRFPHPGEMPLTFKPLWKAASQAFILGLILGNTLQWLLGGTSALTSLIGVPLYLLIFSLLLRRRFPAAYGAQRWWLTPAQVLLATLAACLTIYVLMLLVRQLTG